MPGVSQRKITAKKKKYSLSTEAVLTFNNTATMRFNL